MKTVLMACTHAIDSNIRVGSYYFARGFLEWGYRVLYLPAPLSLIHKVSKQYDTDTRHNYVKSEFIEVEQNLFALTPYSLIAPAGIFPLNSRLVQNHWHYSISHSITEMVAELCPVEIDLLYVDNIFYHFLLDAIPHKQSIFRVMDDHRTFPGWNKLSLSIPSRIAKQSDLTIYSGAQLAEYVNLLGVENSLCLPNGVNFSEFEGLNQIDRSKNKSLLYCGVIDERFNFDFIIRVAEKLKQYTFNLAGKVLIDQPHKLPDNINFLGEVNRDELHLLMKNALAGLLPFDNEVAIKRILASHPLKAMEYFSAGLPTIAPNSIINKDDKFSYHCYDTEEDFIKQIHTLSSSGNRHQKSNSEIASACDWSERLSALRTAVNL